MEDRLDPVLRALPSALRGASSGCLKFDNTGQLVISPELPSSLAGLLVEVLEPCVLFRELDGMLRRVAPYGLLRQALYSGIKESLRSYLSLISEIEVIVARKPAPTLASLQIMLQSPTLYLRLFLSICRKTSHINANVLSVLFEYTQHGDPLIQSHAQELYDRCHATFQRLLSEWENYGSLSIDVFQEIFIRPGKEAGEFVLVADRVPHPMTTTEAENCLERGRALYFIREVCGNASYEGFGKSTSDILKRTYELLMVDHQLLEHFRGLRDYLLLANGNFVDALFRNDSMDFLMQPVNDVGSYMASEFFVSTVEDLSAGTKENNAVIKSVDAYILGIDSLTAKQKNWRVWEAFIGKYHLDSRPLQIMVDHRCATIYERCFASFWRIRLAIYSLNESFMRLRWLGRGGNDEDAIARLVEVHSVMNSGMLQVQQFLYYYVIDQEWAKLEERLSGTKTLSLAQVKDAHDKYLNKIAEAAATPTRSRAIQGLTKIAMGFQRIVEDAEIKGASSATTDEELTELVSNFNELHASLDYEG